jgi:acetyl-CoA carboxylase biotin carboxyl carrier protein
VLTFEQIQEIIAAVAEHGIESVEIERSGFRLLVVGRSAPTVAAASAPTAAALPVAAPVAATGIAPAQPQGAQAGPVDEPPPPEEPAGHIVTSPIVGTFYAAPNPEAEAFVGIGDRVKKGQVLCIVEAMKLMNEIESDVDGVIVEIFPQDAQPVEFGERLFAVSTD